MSPADRERARTINILDCIQETVLKHRRPEATDEYTRHHNALVMWFSDLLDLAQERIVKGMVIPEEESDAA